MKKDENLLNVLKSLADELVSVPVVILNPDRTMADDYLSTALYLSALRGVALEAEVAITVDTAQLHKGDRVEIQLPRTFTITGARAFNADETVLVEGLAGGVYIVLGGQPVEIVLDEGEE